MRCVDMIPSPDNMTELISVFFSPINDDIRFVCIGLAGALFVIALCFALYEAFQEITEEDDND